MICIINNRNIRILSVSFTNHIICSSRFVFFFNVRMTCIYILFAVILACHVKVMVTITVVMPFIDQLNFYHYQLWAQIFFLNQRLLYKPYLVTTNFIMSWINHNECHGHGLVTWFWVGFCCAKHGKNNDLFM